MWDYCFVLMGFYRVVVGLWLESVAITHLQPIILYILTYILYILYNLYNWSRWYQNTTYTKNFFEKIGIVDDFLKNLRMNVVFAYTPNFLRSKRK